MNAAKIRLSQTEMELLMNADWILTKNSILLKTIQLLAAIQQQQQQYLQQYAVVLSATIIQSTPKISKGENYKGLPYQVLDYPRVFAGKDIFTIRTMFWWGNFFSVTLHCSGAYQKLFAPKIIAGYDQLARHNFFSCVNADQWEHHFEETNYQSIAGIDKTGWEERISQQDFFKISGRVDLSRWNNAEELLLNYFNLLLELLA